MLKVFPSQFDYTGYAMAATEDSRVFSNAGSPVDVTYKPVVSENGSIELQIDGEVDVYSQIQSHADSVDINLILERYKRGDIGALDRREGIYFDATAMPKTYREMLQRVIDAENYFNTLDPKVKAEFNNDPAQFIASLGDLSNKVIEPPKHVEESVETVKKEGDE